MADSVKSKIIAKLLDICQPLIDNNTLRKVERVLSPFQTESLLPAMHLIIGAEIPLYQDERGYNIQFPASFKIIIDAGKGRYELVDQLAAFLEEKIEADEQLGGLCSKITFDGVHPYVDEVIEGGFVIISYKVEYRRMKARPDVGY